MPIRPDQPPPFTVCAMVLAGGLGSRMGGVDKGLQPFRGIPLAQNAIARLHQQLPVAPTQVAVNANRNPDAYAELGVPVWPDMVSDAIPAFAGPLAGMLSGLAQCAGNCEFLLTVPCDSPLFPLDLLARLAEALRLTTQYDRPPADIAMACAPEQRGDGTWVARKQPVFLLMRTHLGPDLASYLAAGGRKIDDWCARHPMEKVVFDRARDRLAFANANTLAELENLQALES
jgi:molybdopterin-guanine dinucleotide biosynthesis protein A